jgi:hypothetical protein
MPKDVHILPVSVRLSLGRSSVLTIVHLPNPQKVGNASVAIPGVERKFKIHICTEGVLNNQAKC